MIMKLRLICVAKFKEEWYLGYDTVNYDDLYNPGSLVLEYTIVDNKPFVIVLERQIILVHYFWVFDKKKFYYFCWAAVPDWSVVCIGSVSDL